MMLPCLISCQHIFMIILCLFNESSFYSCSGPNHLSMIPAALYIFAYCHLHLLPSIPLLILLLHPPSHFLDSFPKHLVYHTLVRGSLCDLFSSKGDLISHSIFVFADMIRRRHLRTRSIKMFVLDESDEMLNKGIPYLRNHSPCRHCNSHFYIHVFFKIMMKHFMLIGQHFVSLHKERILNYTGSCNPMLVSFL